MNKVKKAYEQIVNRMRYEEDMPPYCEVCGMCPPRFGCLNHIVSKGRIANPKHPNLHNERNLILVCMDCHREFEHGNELTDRYIVERELWDLFPDVINKNKYL